MFESENKNKNKTKSSVCRPAWKNLTRSSVCANRSRLNEMKNMFFLDMSELLPTAAFKTAQRRQTDRHT